MYEPFKLLFPIYFYSHAHFVPLRLKQQRNRQNTRNRSDPIHVSLIANCQFTCIQSHRDEQRVETDDEYTVL